MPTRASILFLGGLAAVAVAAACGDAGSPVASARPGVIAAPLHVVQAYVCTVDAVARTMACAEPAPRTGDAPAIIIGGSNGYNVLLTSTNFTTPAPADSVTGGEYAFDVTIENRIVQAIGTADGVTRHADGIRIFFSEEPAVTVPYDATQPRSVTVSNADGTAIFTSAPADYFQYDTLLLDQQVSNAKRWKFGIVNAKVFTFKVLVSTQVRYSKGWLVIAPGNPVVAVSQLDTLAATVRDVHGKLVTDVVTWTSSNPGVVTVSFLTSQAAQITGVAAGTAWVKGASSVYPPHRQDSVLVTVN